MTKKRVLNVSSKKKRDTMVSFSNMTVNSYVPGTTYTVGPAGLQASPGRIYIMPWVASARTGFYDQQQQPATAIDTAVRTSTVCYMKGVKEKIQIQTNSGASWQWRRICFTMKSDTIYNTETDVFRASLLTSNGMVRVVNHINNQVAGSNLVDILFEGQQNNDWVSPFTAKVDTAQVDLKYDKTRKIQSGNATGVMRNYNMWHPMNKNLWFDDEENGGRLELGRYSVKSKRGMGDYYIIDMFAAATGSQTADFLTFEPTATLYWHEK